MVVQAFAQQCQDDGYVRGSESWKSCVTTRTMGYANSKYPVGKPASQYRRACKNAWGREVDCSELERDRTYQTDCYGNPNSYSCTTRRQ